MSLSISGTVQTTSGMDDIGPLTIPTNTSGLSQRTTFTPASGANTVTVPSWAKVAIIIPNVSNLVGMTLKGVTGDTGVPISPTVPTELPWPSSPPASFVITAASLFTTSLEVLFY